MLFQGDITETFQLISLNFNLISLNSKLISFRPIWYNLRIPRQSDLIPRWYHSSLTHSLNILFHSDITYTSKWYQLITSLYNVHRPKSHLSPKWHHLDLQDKDNIHQFIGDIINCHCDITLFQKNITNTLKWYQFIPMWYHLGKSRQSDLIPRWYYLDLQHDITYTSKMISLISW